MKAIYAGSFNLFHAGHYYVYNKACQMFGKENVWLCVAINPDKNIEPDFIKWTLNPITPNVIITDGLVTNENPDVLIRGLRDTMDLASEMTMADWNEKLGCNTIFIPCTGNLRHISSSALRELYHHKVDIDNDENIPAQIHLSFKRWQKKELPDRKLFCGKIAIGKSTYLKDNFISVGDCDKLIWKFFDTEQKEYFKYQLTTIINTNPDDFSYVSMLKEMSEEINWYELFSDEYEHYEVSALGQWYSFIPVDILCKFQIVELTINEDDRLKRIASRGLYINQVKRFDKFYVTPFFVDEVIDIGEINDR